MPAVKFFAYLDFKRKSSFFKVPFSLPALPWQSALQTIHLSSYDGLIFFSGLFSSTPERSAGNGINPPAPGSDFILFGLDSDLFSL
jgi:hypothetical protein